VRLLYLADIRFPLERANGIQTFETCRALAARGHEVTLLVRPDTSTPPRDPWFFYGAERVPGFTIDRIASVPESMRRACYVTTALGRVIARSGDVVFTRDLGLASLALGVPRSRRPALVYEAHGYAPAVSQELPRLLGTSARPSPRKLARLARRESRVWRRAEGYVTLTSAHRSELVARFGPRDAAVVPDGTRLPRVRRFEPPPAGLPMVGYAGHLYPWKGVDVLIEAIARRPDLRGLVVGGHPGERDLARLQALAHARGIADRVEFTGWRPPQDVAASLARCHALALPNVRSTISERYTSPLKLFDYLAAGRPIVASDLPAIREVLTDQVNGLLVEPGRADVLADALGRVLDDGALAERLSRKAFDDADRYSWDARAGRLEPVLQAAEVAA
jgi:glycosyltransferase involved in cell wall biosynthesis